MYILAEYKTPSNRLNQVVLWDTIMCCNHGACSGCKSHHGRYTSDGALKRTSIYNKFVLVPIPAIARTRPACRCAALRLLPTGQGVALTWLPAAPQSRPRIQLLSFWPTVCPHALRLPIASS